MSTPQPGWYRDPYAPGNLRWWDGLQWTAPVVPEPAAVGRRAPQHAGHTGRVGRPAMLAQAALSVLTTAVAGFVGAELIRSLLDYLDAAATAPPGELPPPSASLGLLTLLLSLVGLLNWVPLVLELLWAHRSATTAAALGIPAKREPIWATVSWFIPVVSWWFPYESIRDCLPPEHPTRPTVGWWWAGYLVGSSGAVVAVLAGLAGVGALIVVIVVYAAIAVATSMAGLKVVAAIDAAHRERMNPAPA